MRPGPCLVQGRNPTVSRCRQPSLHDVLTRTDPPHVVSSTSWVLFAALLPLRNAGGGGFVDSVLLELREEKR